MSEIDHTGASELPNTERLMEPFLKEARNIQADTIIFGQSDKPVNQVELLRLEEVAQGMKGQQPWKTSEQDIMLSGNGRFACAIDVSHALHLINEKVDAKTVGQLVDGLMAKAWAAHPESEARPGGVMIAYDPNSRWKLGGGHAHVGIIADNGQVYNNSNRQHQKWALEPLDVAFPRDEYPTRIVLLPHGSDDHIGHISLNTENGAKH